MTFYLLIREVNLFLIISNLLKNIDKYWNILKCENENYLKKFNEKFLSIIFNIIVNFNKKISLPKINLFYRK